MKKNTIHTALSLAALSAGVGRSTRFDHREESDAPTLAEIGDKVEKGLGAIRTEQKSLKEQLLADVGNLDKKTVDVLKDIESLKKNANDTEAGRGDLLKKFNLLDARINQQLRSTMGSIRRIQSDDEMRERFNLAIRLSMDKDGDMQRKYAPRIKALGEDSSPGSTLINTALAKEIYDTLTTFGIWNTFGVRNLGTKLTIFPVKTARPVAGYVLTEAGTIADDTNKAGTTVQLEAEVIAVLLNVSLQLLQDAEFDVTGDIMNDFAEAYAKVLDYSCISADGTADATNGGMTGVLSGWTAATAANGNTTVEGLQLVDFTRVLLTVDPIVLTRPAKWWLHPQILIRTMAIQDTNKRPLFQTALEAPSPGAIGSILGYPVIPGYIMPTTNTAGSKVAAFGDPEALVVGVRSDYTFESSDHHKWNTLQRSFRGWGRAGVKVRAATGGAYLKLAAS